MLAKFKAWLLMLWNTVFYPKGDLSLINVMKRRVSKCKHGHDYTPENSKIGPDGKRRCRTCYRLDMKRRRAAKK